MVPETTDSAQDNSGAASGESAAGQTGRPSSPAAAERHPGFRAIGIAASRVAAPIAKRRGGGLLVRLKTDWAAIVGEIWAPVSWPMALGRDGTLKLRVLSQAALDLQHRTPLVIERVNLYFGRPVATRLVLVQGPLPLAPPTAPPLRALPATDLLEALDKHLVNIPDAGLQAALTRLGRAVAAAEAHASPMAPEDAPERGTE
jgi:hypothetical protein